MVWPRSLGFAAAGAAFAQFLPGLVMESQMTNGHAAWGWKSQMPKCVSPKNANWKFKEGTSVAAGVKATVECVNTGGTPSVAAIECPTSDGKQSPDNGWWGICGVGPKCLSDNEIGDKVKCTGGTPPATTTTTATTTTAKSTSTSKSIATSTVSVGVVLIAGAGAMYV
eukprot:TRINITY_DN10698_c0_g1_i1.p1 TRINITY_DN10698_c0_g1~~TRINITY_DN10698_c0_g1_i1.p1  ORF type:complete len:168 (+),score=42.93 TRINITY_DN10698_c0_g1_i1:77-580(+)